MPYDPNLPANQLVGSLAQPVAETRWNLPDDVEQRLLKTQWFFHLAPGVSKNSVTFFLASASCTTTP